MVDIIVSNKLHDKVSNVQEEKINKLSELDKDSRADTYLILCIGIETLNDNRNLTFTPQNRTGKIRYLNILELHFTFIYNHQSDNNETEKQSKSLPVVDKSLKISGLHQIQKY